MGWGAGEAGEGSSTHPRLVVTTTPRPTRALVRLRDEAGCALTHAPTADNAENLSPGFLDNLHALYGGTRRAAQELDGQIVELDGALFTAEMMARARAPIAPLPSSSGLTRGSDVPASSLPPATSAPPGPTLGSSPRVTGDKGVSPRLLPARTAARARRA